MSVVKAEIALSFVILVAVMIFSVRVMVSLYHEEGQQRERGLLGTPSTSFCSNMEPSRSAPC